MTHTFLFPLLLLSFSARAAVFGVDDRISIRPGGPGHDLSRSTAVAVLSSNLETVGGVTTLLTDELSQFCPTVRFVKQRSLAYACTGFLVAPDLLMTAGHCMVNTGESRNETELYCKAFSWLFDYNEATNTKRVNTADLYKCKRVIYAVKDERAPFRDYALVQLARPVKGRTPYKLNAAPVVATDRFSMIGHPFGLPSKLSLNGRTVVNDGRRQSFLTTLDAFEGNSGSPVFNARNEVVGILVGGTPSANTVTSGRCEVLNRCDENGRNCLEADRDTSVFPGYQGVGSEVQRIAPALQLLRSVKR